MLRAGLIGSPLGHSWSADYFARQYPDCHYQSYERPSLDGLRRWVESEHLNGFNVTIPYKTAIMELLDNVDETARRIGAVNCVCVRRADGRLTLEGHNTDYRAFADTLQPLLQPCHQRALVLGTGGAAKAVAYALQQLGIDYTFVSRHPELHHNAIGYEQLSPSIQNIPSNESQFNILINATPVGMWPHTEESPTPDIHSIVRKGYLCYDLIYNPEKTRWMLEAAQCGATVCNGLAMLHRQADLSHALWLQEQVSR